MQYERVAFVLERPDFHLNVFHELSANAVLDESHRGLTLPPFGKSDRFRHFFELCRQGLRKGCQLVCVFQLFWCSFAKLFGHRDEQSGTFYVRIEKFLFSRNKISALAAFYSAQELLKFCQFGVECIEVVRRLKVSNDTMCQPERKTGQGN